MTRSNEKLIPLNQQPAYQVAIGAVIEIGRALSATNEKLDRMRADLINATSQVDSSPSIIDRALALAGGQPISATQPVAAEIKQLEEEKEALLVGLKEANKVASTVSDELAMKVGAQFRAQHVEAVKRIVGCLEALCEANKAEASVREGLEKLGYHRHGLTYQGFGIVGQIDDSTGSPAYYFAKDARRYINSTQGR